ncbi:PAS-like protein [Pseudomonas syringae pv. cilantro]|uniref:histidine kinase n=2 Tax=Pseudomonas syringae group TaxID=136849 RepID=A0A0N0GDW2_PSESX|nr:PAS-like protein [Pseudomonas syringae pv. cilantro]KPW71264.1 PAS protein [Pseudomonas syringae pv. coriandricola]RMN09686.1 PAS protein [Pseudomonas syringae pv. coriandricola]
MVRVFDGLARQKDLDLVLELDSRLNTDVLIDPLRFKQILSNLVSNAIKFTRWGQVKISLQAPDTPDPQQLHVHLTVQDSGIGISVEDQRRLFEPFAQADNTGQMARTGAGLGLVICRSLCTMMGGSLSLDSEPGIGTRINMQLMLTTLEPLASQPAALPVVPQAQQALNILVVDDHPANRLLLCEQLGFLSHHCEMAENGAQGLQRWLAGDFDLVVADCNMPVMNGYDLTRAIRARELADSLPRCRVLGFTANAQHEETQRCLDAGMDDCLFKPISLRTLNEQLSRLTPLPRKAKPFSLQSISSLTGDRPEMVERLIAQLLSSNKDDQLTLVDLLREGDRRKISEMAHRIKGAARIINADKVVQACDDLEHACEQNGSETQLKACHEGLDLAMSELEKALREQQH